MKVLGLPGKRESTFEWLSELINKLELNATATHIQSYKCWDVPDSELDEVLESNQAQQIDPDLIIAKSIGTLVALLAFGETAKRRKFILIGIPLGIYSANEIASLNQIAETSSLLIIQQTADPTGTAGAVRLVLNQPDLVVEVPGNDHAYSDVEQLSDLIGSWLSPA